MSAAEPIEIIDEVDYLPAEIIDGPPETGSSVTLFGTENPMEVVTRATEVAGALAEIIKKQNLATSISGRDHVRVEGWTLLGSMLGVYPICVWSRKLEDGWEARVEARTRTGDLVGAAESECLRSESKWKQRDDYALRSMAQTRATSKALRLPLGFVMQLAGFDPTPVEEMPQSDGPPREREPEGFPVPRNWAEVKAAFEAYDAETWNWMESFTRQASRQLYGKEESKELNGDQRKMMLEKARTVTVKFRDAHPGPDMMPPPSIDDLRAAWASVLSGIMLPGPEEMPSPGEELDAGFEAAVQDAEAEAEQTAFVVPEKARTKR